MPNKKIKVLVPTVKAVEFDIEEIKIINSNLDMMKCDGCGNNMGSRNPIGLIKANEIWWKLCHSCCVSQGFIKDDNSPV